MNTGNIFNINKKKLIDLASSYKIELILVFGSYAKRNVHKRSDLDIGIYSQEKITPHDLWELQTKLMELFGRDDIDVVILNDTSPVLLFNILKHHTLLYISNNNLLNQFKTMALKRYWHYLTHFKKFADNLERKRLKKLGIV